MADDTFHMEQLRDAPGRWILHVLLAGDSDTSQFQSYDDGVTWKKIGTVIPNGTHPTVGIGQDGTFDTVVFAAYVSGNIQAKTQTKGDPALSDLFSFDDPSEVKLAVADDTFQIAQAKDAQVRWMLHVKISGDGTTTQWTSFDECFSWTKVS